METKQKCRAIKIRESERTEIQCANMLESLQLERKFINIRVVQLQSIVDKERSR